MHELSIAIEILRAARKELDLRGGGRLETVRVAIGELSAVEPELLEYAWRVVVAERGHTGAQLVVEEVRAEQTCPACGPVDDRQPGTWLRLCPHCDRPLRVTGGRELDLVELTFEHPLLPVEVPS